MDMKKWFSNNKNKDAQGKERGIYKLLDKEGFYIILFICVCIVATTAVWVTKTNIDRLAVDDLQRPLFPMEDEIPDYDFGFDGEEEDESPVVVIEERDKVEPVIGGQQKNTGEEKVASIEVASGKQPVQKVAPAAASAPAAKAVFKMPVVGDRGMNYAADTLVYSKTLDHYTTHYGIDIIAPENTPVVAALSGEVVEVVVDSRLGITITIAHEGDILTKYANLSTGNMVKVGDKVEKGQVISGIGRSALFEISEEPHLHFEVMVDGEHVDPNLYLPKN